MSATVEVKTDREFLDEMVQLIEGTHWTKNALVCVNVVNDRYANGKLKYRTITLRGGGAYNADTMRYDDKKVTVTVPKIGEDGKVVTKPTACLVGLVLRVEGADWYPEPKSVEPDFVNRLINNDPEAFEDDDLTLNASGDFTEALLGEQGRRIVTKLAHKLFDDKSLGHEIRSTRELFSSAQCIAAIESWNDREETTREMVKKIVIGTRDAEPQDATA